MPTTSFSQRDLSGEVQGAGHSDQQHSVLAYRQVNSNNMFTGPLRLIRFDRISQRVVRSRLKLPADEICRSSGSADYVSFVREFTLVTTPVSPSANCLLVLDKALRFRRIFHGFEPVEALPYQLLLSEDMIHFSPVHPERLQLADLRTGKTIELYPPKEDPLRARLIREHAARMPPNDTCTQMNDPCSPELFDETVEGLATDGRGRFAFVAIQSADHATKPDTPPGPVVAQTVLYVYQQQDGIWFYCEDRVSDAEVDPLTKALANNVSTASARCKPTIRVVPDLSTASYNPFFNTNPDKQRAPR